MRRPTIEAPSCRGESSCEVESTAGRNSGSCGGSGAAAGATTGPQPRSQPSKWCLKVLRSPWLPLQALQAWFYAKKPCHMPLARAILQVPGGAIGPEVCLCRQPSSGKSRCGGAGAAALTATPALLPKAAPASHASTMMTTMWLLGAV